MRVTHFLYTGAGGLGTYFMNFVHSDKNEIFDNTVIFYGVEPLDEEYENFCRKNKIDFKIIKKRRGIDLLSLYKCVKYLFFFKPQFVFSHTSSVFLAAYFFKILKSKKLIYIDHTSSKVKSKYEIWNSILAYKFSDYFVVFYQKQIQELFKISNFCKKRKVYVISKYVDTKFFKPNRKLKGNKEFIIGMVGRMVEGKDHELLIIAVYELLKKKKNIKLFLSSEGVKKNSLCQLAKKLNISDKIIFTGDIKYDKMPEFYNSLDIYVHASAGETNCYSILEAQSCGLPVVASDVKGINDIFVKNKDLLMFKRNSLIDLIEAIEKLINHKVNYDLFSSRSRQIALINEKKNNLACQYYNMLSSHL